MARLEAQGDRSHDGVTDGSQICLGRSVLASSLLEVADVRMREDRTCPCDERRTSEVSAPT